MDERYVFADGFAISISEINKVAKVGLAEICKSLPVEARRLDVVKLVLKTISNDVIEMTPIMIK
ncbi:MAG: hypothetical protein ACI4IS_00370 [Acutalibacteraceae bacterium]